MAIPIKYRKSTDALINFDFADILSNVGYVNFFAIISENASERLTRQTTEGTTILSQFTGETSGSVEKNFDFEFNISKLVKGDLFVSITIFADGSGSSQAFNDTTIEIIHVDSASSETSIGTQQSITQLVNPVSTPQDEYRTTLIFAVNKQFKKGDKLRIEIITTMTGGNTNDKAGFYHDPANRDFSLTDQHNIAARSDLLIQVPFDLDI